MNQRFNAAAIGTVLGLAGAANAAAQTRIQDKFFGEGESDTDTASAGNGGVATASANGGAVSVGDINSGGNVCNAIGIGDTYRPGSGRLWWRLPEHDRSRHRGQRRHRHRGRLRRQLQPRLRQLAQRPSMRGT